ncbi:E3 ubiquitin-protein ligase rad18 [Gurleya vavrai]
MNLCSICKEEIYIPSEIPCSHIFCMLCIKKHLYKSNFCPTCFFSPLHVNDIKSNTGTYMSKFDVKKNKIEFFNGKFVTSGERGFEIVNACKKNAKSKEKTFLDNHEVKDYINKEIEMASIESIKKNSYKNNFDNQQSQNVNFDIFKSQKTSQKLPKIKPILFGKITDANLKKTCQKFSLRTGTRKEMIDRLNEFYLLYSIEREVINPVSLYGLAAIVNKKQTKKEFDIDKYIVKNIENIFEIRRIFLEKYRLTRNDM